MGMVLVDGQAKVWATRHLPLGVRASGTVAELTTPSNDSWSIQVTGGYGLPKRWYTFTVEGAVGLAMHREDYFGAPRGMEPGVRASVLAAFAFHPHSNLSVPVTLSADVGAGVYGGALLVGIGGMARRRGPKPSDEPEWDGI